MPRAIPADLLDDAVDLALTGLRRVAVVGLSGDPARASHGVAQALLRRGVDVVPVNPTVDEVLGRRAYPDIASVPGRIDVVDVFRRPEHLADVAREAVARDDVGVVWNQLGLRSAEAREVVLGAGRGYVEDTCLKVAADVAGARAPAGDRLLADAVLLDLDDTLLDHDACERAAAAATLVAHGLPADDAAVDVYVAVNEAAWGEYRRGELDAATLRRVRWERTVRRLAPGGDVDVDVVAVDYLDRFGASRELLPGAREALWWLGRRARVAIVTNGFTDTQTSRLTAAGLDGLLDAVVTSEEAAAPKPDPSPIRLALERLGLDPSGAPAVDAVLVGDQLATDVAAAAAAGVRAVWIAPDDAVLPAGAPPVEQRVARLAHLV